MIAQLVARRSHNPKVVSSILTHRILYSREKPFARLDQFLERPVWVAKGLNSSVAMGRHKVGAGVLPLRCVPNCRLGVNS